MACVVPGCSPQLQTPAADDRPLYSQAEQHGSVGGTPPYLVYLKSAIEYIQDYQNGSLSLIGEYLKSAIEYIQDYQNGSPCLIGEYLKSAIEYTQDYQNGSPCLIGEYLTSAIEYIQDYQNGPVGGGGGGGTSLLCTSKISDDIHTRLSEWITLPYLAI